MSTQSIHGTTTAPTEPTRTKPIAPQWMVRTGTVAAALVLLGIGVAVLRPDATIERSPSPAVESPARTTTDRGPNADLPHYLSTAAVPAVPTANLGPNADLPHYRIASVAPVAPMANLGPNADLPHYPISG